MSQDDTIRVWDLNIEQPRFILNGHVNVGTEVVFSSDGATIASGGDWPENTIQLWNPDTGALRDTLEGHTDSISALAFSADGTTLASGSRDKTIRLWNTHTAELKTMFEGQRREVQSLAFAPDGKPLPVGAVGKIQSYGYGIPILHSKSEGWKPTRVGFMRWHFHPIAKTQLKCFSRAEAVRVQFKSGISTRSVRLQIDHR